MVNNNFLLIFQIGVVNNNNSANSIRSILMAINGYAVVFKVGCIMVNNNISLMGSIHTMDGFIGKFIFGLINVFLLDLWVYCYQRINVLSPTPGPE